MSGSASQNGLCGRTCQFGTQMCVVFFHLIFWTKFWNVQIFQKSDESEELWQKCPSMTHNEWLTRKILVISPLTYKNNSWYNTSKCSTIRGRFPTVISAPSMNHWHFYLKNYSYNMTNNEWLIISIDSWKFNWCSNDSIIWLIKQVLINLLSASAQKFLEIAWSRKVLTPTQIIIFGHAQ